MYKSLQVKIIKNPLNDSDSDSDSDYEYLFDDDLQILSESGDILFNLKGYEFKSYECIDNYLIVDIDEGHKFTLHNIYIDLFDFTVYEELFKKDNEYYSSFCLNNPNIILSQIIDFNLMKLVYDLNTDIFEKTNLAINDDDTAVITVLLKHFFKDLGLPQKYSVLHIQRILDEDKIIFKGKTKENIANETLMNFPINAELLSISLLMLILCDSINNRLKYAVKLMLDDLEIQPEFTISDSEFNEFSGPKFVYSKRENLIEIEKCKNFDPSSKVLEILLDDKMEKYKIMMTKFYEYTKYSDPDLGSLIDFFNMVN
jgi:hypothetical protein